MGIQTEATERGGSTTYQHSGKEVGFLWWVTSTTEVTVGLQQVSSVVHYRLSGRRWG